MHLSIPLAALFASLTLALANPICIDHYDPRDLTKRARVPCPLVHDIAPRQAPETFNSSQAFVFDFYCDASPELCLKAKEGFRKSGEILSSFISFAAPVRVNASFHLFCKSDPEIDENCRTRGLSAIAGLAKPTRMMLLQDDDNVQRIYPQTVVKQFNLTPRPAYHTYDIYADFNAELPWHFWADGPKLASAQQTDFEETVVHELLHGLGFLSSWANLPASPGSLIPAGLIYDEQENPMPTDDFFVESVLDRYMTLVSGASPQRCTEFTKALNAASTKLFTQSTTPAQVASLLETAPDFQPARDMMKAATTNDTLALLPFGAQAPNDYLWLETGLPRYRQGSSVSHVAMKHYWNTSQRLMMFAADRPMSLAESIAQYGGPVGPLLLRAMASIGYQTKDKLPVPPIPKVAIPNPSPASPGQ
ncbi:uncharacterized protein VTP21DRAFT_137 [Calcarisporiella thermophila]|uniref:uncharacterized protein n=1 Tax=Calcarisporiella thermophila TaxID=911321 RepID=UPI003744794B